MTTESYEHKRHELEAGGPVYASIAASMGLMGFALFVVQIIL